MHSARKLTDDTYILPSEFSIPGFGTLPVNSFVIKSQEPLLVDTGLHLDAGEYMTALESVIDPEDLRWLYLTHPDLDHVGSLIQVLERAPQIRLITTFLGFGILSLTNQIPMDRLYFLNPGEKLDIGDRTITAIKPPTFDNPATTGFYDSKSGVLFSSDCFGALLPETFEDAGDVPQDVLRQGQVIWTTIDSPWLHKIEKSAFASDLNSIRQMAPKMVLSSHLPPAKSMTDWMLGSLEAAPGSEPFVGPNQPALEAMMAQMTGATA
jgi:flavorubredoxin